MRTSRFIFLSCLAALALAWTAVAVEPDEMLDNPALEERARIVSQELRCVVCQNETIDESNATLAQDMRRLVRKRILEGDTNEEVLAYMVDRYGEFVLLRPRVIPQTWLLWFGPLLVLGLGVIVVFRTVRRAPVRAPEALSAAEQARLQELKSGERPGHPS
jgi:cytochrome c-type biogenesis protein CcmH